MLSSIVTMLYIGSSDLNYLTAECMSPFTNLSLFPPPLAPGDHFSICFYEFDIFFLGSTYKGYHAGFVFICLAPVT